MDGICGMRAALSALLAMLLAGGCAAGGLDGLFPAGLPRVEMPFMMPPYEPPALPENAYRGLYGHATCAADVLISPGSTAETVAAIRDVRARAEREGRPLRLRATRPSFATMNSMPCAGQPTEVTPFTVRGQTPLVAGAHAGCLV
jgi:hypothetical protein